MYPILLPNTAERYPTLPVTGEKVVLVLVLVFLISVPEQMMFVPWTVWVFIFSTSLWSRIRL